MARVRVFDPPGSVGTYPTCINADGAIAGYYFANHGVHGFTRSPAGAVAVFDSPDADDGTYVRSINDAGVITGYYQKGANVVAGFLRYTDSSIREFDAGGRTFALGVADNGLVSGYLYNGTYDAGFTRDARGKIKQFQVKSMNTTATASNASRTIVGSYYDGSRWHGYIRMP